MPVSTKAKKPSRETLGFSTLGCPDANFASVIQIAANYGLDAVELRCLNGETLAPENIEQALGTKAEATSLLDKRNIRISMIGSSERMFALDDSSLSNLLNWARWADALGCPWVRVFDGGNSAIASDQQIARVSDWFASWESQRSAEGIRAELAIETHDALTNPETLYRLLQAIPEIRILWDAHHTWRARIELERSFNQMRSNIVHVHAKDSVTTPGKPKGLTYVSPGQGEFPWNELLYILPCLAPDVVVSFEWEKKWNPELPPLEMVLPHFLNTMRG